MKKILLTIILLSFTIILIGCSKESSFVSTLPSEFTTVPTISKTTKVPTDITNTEETLIEPSPTKSTTIVPSEKDPTIIESTVPTKIETTIVEPTPTPTIIPSETIIPTPTPTLPEPTEPTVEPTEIIPTVNETEDEPMNLYIDDTYTLSANTLWNIRNENTTTNIILSNNNLVIENINNLGIYESLPIETSSFDELVLSWNIKDLDKARLNFLVSIGNEEGSYSDWFNMGLWAKTNPQSYSNQSNSFGSVSTDTLINKDRNNYTYIKIRVVIINNNDTTFKLSNISVTTKKKEEIIIIDESILVDKELNVPAINQMSIPTIGNLICSPTSLTMVLNYYGYNYNPVEIAEKVKDHNRGIYGNWTFNTSYAGSHNDIYSRVEYITDFNKLVNYINNDIPVVLSITTKSKDDLPGSLQGYPSGHLIVLTGFKQINNVWYAVINDPAFYNDNDVRVLYRLDLVLNAFKGYTYIVDNKPFE